MILGIILLIIGLLLMVMLWPMMGTIDGDELVKKQEKGESGKFTVMNELTEDEWKGIQAARDDPIGGELAKEMTKGIDGAGTYVYTVKLDNGLPTDISEAQKVPTTGGILGLVLLIVGVILMLVGIIKMKKAKRATMAPPPPPM